MHDTGFSCCCGQNDCARLQEFNECFRKTENDALLAAGKNRKKINPPYPSY